MAVGFSGGGDSLALLLVACDWARRRGVELVALHVDHGLRSASGAEAAQAAAAAERLGVACRILRWEGEKPASGVQAAARAERHRLLACACAEIGSAWLLLGHTEDDRIETAFMRLQRPDASARAAAGLAPVAPSPAWPEGAGLALVRPLLGARRADLRARLRAAGCGWIDDPSNEDPAYERIRARRRLAELGPAAIADIARQADRAAEAEAGRRERGLAALAAFAPGPFGTFTLDRAAFACRLEGGGGALALEAVLGAVAGDPRPLEGVALGRLAAALDPEAPFAGATLGGAVLAAVSHGRAVLTRDPGAVLGRQGRSAHTEVRARVWDGRFRLESPLAGGEVIVPAEGFRAGLPKPDRELLLKAHPSARRAAPVILCPEGPSRLAAGVFIASQAIARRLLPQRPAAWSSVAAACTALGYGSATHHMGSCQPASDLTRTSSRPKGTLQA